MSADMVILALAVVVVSIAALGWYAHRVRRGYLDSLDTEEA